MVKREDLDNHYKNLMGIEILKKDIDDMLETDDGYCSDSILDYRNGKPMPNGISGFDIPRFRRKLRRFSTKKEKRGEIESFMNAIPDEVTRKVFELRLNHNRTWKEIAKEIGCPHNPDYPRKCIYDAYLKKVGIK